MAMRFFTGNEHTNYLITVGCHGNAISVYYIFLPSGRQVLFLITYSKEIGGSSPM